MSQFSHGTYCTIVAVDVADSTDPRRTVPHKVAMHEGLHKILKQAFAEADIPLDECQVADRGDGALIFVPIKFRQSLIADRLLHGIHTGLLRHNALYSIEARIQLRLSAHAGQVIFDANGQVGPDIDFACRILDAADAKKTQRDSGGPLAVIVSEMFYRTVIARDPGTAPGLYWKIAVDVKQLHDAAWLRVFGPSELPEDHSNVLPLFPATAVGDLRGLLGDLRVPGIVGLVADAAGPAVPPLPHGETAFGAVNYLMDYNNDGDGFPPALTLVELLIQEVDDTLAAALTTWADARIAAQGLPPRQRMPRQRAGTTAPSAGREPLYLEVAIEHDGIDADTYLVSQWRKEHGADWPTRPDDTQQVYIDDLEAEIDRLVMEAEVAWATRDGCEIILEFIVPRDLLTMPFDGWFKERESAEPRPLSLDYLVVLRSLERMQNKYWHRRWRNRWRQFNDHPSDVGMYFPDSADMRKPYFLELSLKDDKYIGMALSAPPTANPQPGDELTAALREGLPVVVWSRVPGLAEQTRDLITRLEHAGHLVDLPTAVLSARRAALTTVDTSAELRPASDRIATVVLLWDDPYRVVAVDQLAPWQLERKPANER